MGDTSIVTGGYPWRLDGNYQSTVYITNVGAKTASYGGFIRPAGSGRYVMDTRYLEPGETAVMNIGKIRDEQIPDRDGLKLPKNAQFGEIQWYPFFPNGPSHLIGRTEVINRRAHLDSSFSCGSCPCSPNATNAYTNPGSVGVPIGGTASVYAMLVWSDPCNLNYYADSAFNPSSWLTAPGYVNLTTGTSPSTLTGLSPGSQSFYAPYYSDIYIYNPYAYPICAYEETLELDATGYATVSPPGQLLVIGDTTTTLTNCPNTKVRLLAYQIQDSSSAHKAIKANIQTKEQFASKSTNTCNTTIITSETCSGTPSGIIHDTLSVGCNSVDNGCGYTYTKQQWVWCNGSSSVVIGTVGDLVVHDNAISVGGSYTSIKGKVITP